jgi:hypothetical protein
MDLIKINILDPDFILVDLINTYLRLKIHFVAGEICSLKIVLTEFALPNLSVTCICISESFTPNN